ncbi:MAG: alpha/beta hydrolase [Myxococcota bacterium]
MPLDPQARDILAKLGLDRNVDLDAPDPDTLRHGYEALAALQPVEPIAACEDLKIAGPGGELPLRIYRPEPNARRPAVLYFHGGGWVTGSIATHDGTCRKLANATGCTVVSVGYRLAPEARFPAAPEDCYAALCWVAAQGDSLGIDPTRLAVAGDSAGGNLAAVVPLIARERGGPILRHQLLIYPITDHDFETPSYRENASGFLLSRELMIWFWDRYLTEPAQATHPWASPLRERDLAGLPRATVITAELDPLRDEGETYASRLQRAGVPTQQTRYDGMFHGFFSMSDGLDAGRRALAEASDRLRRDLES